MKKYAEEDLPQDWEIEAAVPVYTMQGDCTRIYLEGGRVVTLQIQLKRFLIILAKQHCQTLALLRSRAVRETEMRNAAPLAMDPELVLLPFRCRKPRVEGDNTLGCVNVAAVRAEQLQEGRRTGETVIRLSDGACIEVQWCVQTMRHHWRAARMMEGMLREKAEAALLRMLRKRKK